MATIQTITVPAKTWEFTVPELDINIADPANVKARAHVGRREVGSTNNFIIVPKTILVNDTLQAGVAAGNLTAADVQGFKRVIKSLVAKSLEITFSEVNDPLK